MWGGGGSWDGVAFCLCNAGGPWVMERCDIVCEDGEREQEGAGGGGGGGGQVPSAGREVEGGERRGGVASKSFSPSLRDALPLFYSSIKGGKPPHLPTQGHVGVAVLSGLDAGYGPRHAIFFFIPQALVCTKGAFRSRLPRP